jgi:hypothetical protein
MHIRDPPLEGTLEWQKPAPHNFIYCACSSVKREPRCYIRAPPSVAIFQQVVGNVYAFLCIRITRLISFGVCAGFFSFRGSRGGGYTSLEPRKLQPLWLP